MLGRLTARETRYLEEGEEKTSTSEECDSLAETLDPSEEKVQEKLFCFPPKFLIFLKRTVS